MTTITRLRVTTMVVAICLTIASCTSTGPTGSAPGPPHVGEQLGSGEIGPQGGLVTFRGGRLSVPPGAIPTLTTVRLLVAQAFPESGFSRYIDRQVGPAIMIDLDGVDPLRPLRLELDLAPRTTFDGVAAGGLLLASISGDSIQPSVLPSSRFQPDSGVLAANTPAAGVFAPVAVNLAQLGAVFGDVVFKQLLGIGTDRPSCAGDSVTLADSSVVSIAPAPWQEGADPPLFACVKPSDGKHVIVQVSNNRPDSFTFKMPSTYQVAQLGVPSSSVLVQVVMHQLSNRLQGQDRHFLTSGSTVSIELVVAELPTTIRMEPDALLTVAGAVAAALPLVVGALVLAGVFAPWVAALLGGAALSALVIDCFAAALKPVFDTVYVENRPSPLTDFVPVALDLLVGCLPGDLPQSLAALRAFVPPTAGLVTGLTASAFTIDVGRSAPARTPGQEGQGSANPPRLDPEKLRPNSDGSSPPFVCLGGAPGQPCAEPNGNPISPPNDPSGGPSHTSSPVFRYPFEGETLTYPGSWGFEVEPVPGATGYLWGFFQQGAMVWENYRDEQILSDSEYRIKPGGGAHNAIEPGPLQVWVRASVNGNWTEAAIRNVVLV